MKGEEGSNTCNLVSMKCCSQAEGPSLLQSKQSSLSFGWPPWAPTFEYLGGHHGLLHLVFALWAGLGSVASLEGVSLEVGLEVSEGLTSF